jgi:hypothetical protein
MDLEYVPKGNESMPQNEPVFGGKYEGLCGKQIAIPQYNDESLLRSVRLATAGGILRSSDGKYFFVTAAHAFDVGKPDSGRAHTDNVDFSFEIDEPSDSEDRMESDDANFRGSVTPELSQFGSSGCTTSSVDVLDDFPELSGGSSLGECPKGDGATALPVDTNGKGKDKEKSLPDDFILVGRRLCPLMGKSHARLDYTLIEIDPQFQDLKDLPMDYLSDSPHLHPKSIATKPRDANVLCITSSALLEGKISGTPSYMKIPGSSVIQELWTVKLSGNLMEGDCGSWVIDEQNHELFGHIISGSPTSGVAYVVPTYQLIEDAKSTYGVDLELCTASEPAKRMYGELSWAA